MTDLSLVVMRPAAMMIAFWRLRSLASWSVARCSGAAEVMRSIASLMIAVYESVKAMTSAWTASAFKRLGSGAGCLGPIRRWCFASVHGVGDV